MVYDCFTTLNIIKRTKTQVLLHRNGRAPRACCKTSSPQPAHFRAVGFAKGRRNSKWWPQPTWISVFAGDFAPGKPGKMRKKYEKFTGKIYGDIGDFTWISLDVFIFFRLKGWNYCKRISWGLTLFLHGRQVCGDGKCVAFFLGALFGMVFLYRLGNVGWILKYGLVVGLKNCETTMQFGSFQIDDSDSRSLLLHRNCLWTLVLSY